MADNEEVQSLIDMQHRDLALQSYQQGLEIDSLKALNKQLQDALDKANDVLEADVRRAKTDTILKKTKFSAEDLNEKSIIELDAIIQVIDSVKKPFKPVSASDASRSTARDKLHNLYGEWKRKPQYTPIS